MEMVCQNTNTIRRNYSAVLQRNHNLLSRNIVQSVTTYSERNKSHPRNSSRLSSLNSPTRAARPAALTDLLLASREGEAAELPHGSSHAALPAPLCLPRARLGADPTELHRLPPARLPLPAAAARGGRRLPLPVRPSAHWPAPIARLQPRPDRGWRWEIITVLRALVLWVPTSCKSSAHTASSTFIGILFSCAVPSSEKMLSAQSRAERTHMTHILLCKWIKHEYYRAFVKPVIKAQSLCLRARRSFHTVQDQNRNTGNILWRKINLLH